MKTEGAIKNGHYRDTGNIRENRRSNQEWTIQTLETLEKTEGAIKNG